MNNTRAIFKVRSVGILSSKVRACEATSLCVIEQQSCRSQTNAVKAQDYGNSVLGPAQCFAGGLNAQGTTTNSGAYCATLRKLRRALQNKQRGMLSKGVLLLHDNARPHTSRTTVELIDSFGWEVLDHVLYNPNHAPADFQLFRYLKHSLGGKRFSDNKEGKAAVKSWLSDPAADFFEEGFQNLVLRYDMCINKLVEKYVLIPIKSNMVERSPSLYGRGSIPEGPSAEAQAQFQGATLTKNYTHVHELRIILSQAEIEL
ncbi:histone-lysine N-methyltransferase SETMAR [Trichonephila clavipes]|nr:histone-lysine N-methyltransferase SETMAR [Trichonephila clavipes]